MLKKLGKYELIEEVGRGAMGEVYRAIDPLIGRSVALKTLTKSLAGDPEFLERFYREARSAGALEHANIVTIYELGQSEETPFIAMEFLEGESLEKLIGRRSSLPLVEKVGFIVPICRALEYAHKRGVVHRDIKPGNVMLTKDGKVKVVDFGIARLMNTSQTQTNMFIGTLSYMSPQQIYGQRADERSDIWALGVTFYELLSYQRPFEGDNYAALMLNIAQEHYIPRPVKELTPDLPPALEAIVTKMLEKDIGKRYQTMEEVLLEIEPVWESLQRASISGLIAECESAIQIKQFDRARELLRRALQIDSRNGRARTLLDQVNTEVRHLQISAQTAILLERARTFRKESRFKDAETEAEAALKLDPGSPEARQVLAESRRLAEQKHTIEVGLQSARQRLAEGALTLALQELQKVLERDADNTQGRALQKQIQDQVLRREEQKRVSETLQRARKFWGEQRFDDCAALLTDAQKEFPQDAEIKNLLETARLDFAEQEKLKGLTEVRSYLAAQQFESALSRIQPLWKRYPSDPTVQKLGELVLHEQETTIRQERRNSEIAVLRSLVESGKFSEAVVRGEELMREFSQDSELSDLVCFVRDELAQLKQKRILDEALKGILKQIEAEQFKSAVSNAEEALDRFPGDLALAAALDQAREKLKEKGNRELLQLRVAEIRAKISKGQHTDAVDLAQQTLTTLGPDPQTTHLLRLAEMELAQKREKQQEQEKKIAALQAVVREGHFADAALILQAAFKAQLLSQEDPRVQDLRKKLEDRKPTGARTTGVPIRALETVSEPAADGIPSAQYLLPTDEPVRKSIDAPAEALPGRMGRGASSSTVVFGMDSEANHAATSCPGGEAPLHEQSLFHLDCPPVEDAVPPFSRISVPPHVARILRVITIRIGLGILVLLIAIVGVAYFVVSRPTRQDVHLRAQARQLEQQRNWPAALADYEILAHTPRALASIGQSDVARLRKLLDLEHSLITRARDSETVGDLTTARQLYLQAAGLHGDQQELALGAVDRIGLNPNPPPPAPGPEANSPDLKVRVARKAKPSPSETPSAEAEACHLIPSDVVRHLERADRDRGGGHYIDAERQYKEVLACDPNNERAKVGLYQAYKAAEMERGHPPSN